MPSEFGDDDDGLDLGVDASASFDISGAISDVAKTASTVAQVATTGIKVVAAVKGIAGKPPAQQAANNAAHAVVVARLAATPRPGAPPPPPVVVQAHAQNIVNAAQQHVIALRPAPKVAVLKLAPKRSLWRRAEPFLGGLALGGALAGVGWKFFLIPGAVGGGVLGSVSGFLLGEHFSK